MEKNRKERLLRSAIATCICYSLAHGYHFFQNMFSGDALVLVYQNDYSFEISLGRCFNPLWVFFRGSLLSPWLISALAMLWLTLGVYFTTDLLKMESRAAIAMTAGVLTVNVILVSLYTAFIPWVDLYTLALFFNIVGIWLLSKKKPLFWGMGVLCFTLGLGTYQAYISVAVTLVMILFLTGLSDGHSLKEEFGGVIRYACGLLAGGGIYIVVWKAIQLYRKIGTHDGYNGLAGLTDYSDVSFWGLIGSVYGKVFDYFWNPSVFVSLYFQGHSLSVLWLWVYRILNCMAAAALVWLLIRRNCRNATKLSGRLLQMLGIIVFPFGMNIVCFLSKGMEHTLMQYSFVFLYVFVIRLLHDFWEESGEKQKMRIRLAAGLGIGAICWINVILSNQVYLKLKLEEDAALSMMTRLVNDVEGQEGYEPGKTKVAFAGTWMTSPYIRENKGFEDLSVYMLAKTLFVYPDSEIPFVKYYLHSDMVLTKVDSSAEDIRKMPVYPQKGSIAFVDDVLVVKISDIY